MKNKKLYVIFFFIILLIGIFYTNIAYQKRVSEALGPKNCWIDEDTMSLSQLNQFNLDKIDEDLNKNFEKKDYRFICLRGMAYSFPGISMEQEQKKIIKYGSKLVCVSDVMSDASDYKKAETMYRYIERYNKLLLNKLSDL